MISKSSKKSLKEYGRGIVGGLLFSLPLLYTMEVWWTGFTAPASYLLVFVLVTYLLLLGYNTYAGMRKDATFKDVCWDSVEEIGLALIVSFLFLLLIGQIGYTMSVNEIVGKVIVESMIVAIGISVGTAQLGQDDGNNSGMQGDQQEQEEKNRPSFLKLLILSICGAVLFSSSVAPTEEILIIAIESGTIHLITMVLLSLLLTAIILYFTDFKGSKLKRPAFKEMLFQITLCYLAALFVSFSFLYFFGRVTGHTLFTVLAQMIVLGIPAAIGASLGRLLIKGS